MSHFFKEQLKRQIGFLNLSCAAFDHGFQDEAIRIAMVLRVVFHQTRNSTALLTHFGNPQINLLSTVPESSKESVFFDGITGMAVGGSGPKYIALLGDAPTQCLLPFASWWNQTIFVRNSARATRKLTVLGATNKDGGAHVDPKLNKEYELAISVGRSLQVVMADEDGENEARIEYPSGSHYAALRQMGFEVLASPDFVALVA